MRQVCVASPGPSALRPPPSLLQHSGHQDTEDNYTGTDTCGCFIARGEQGATRRSRTRTVTSARESVTGTERQLRPVRPPFPPSLGRPPAEAPGRGAPSGPLPCICSKIQCFLTAVSCKNRREAAENRDSRTERQPRRAGGAGPPHRAPSVPSGCRGRHGWPILKAVTSMSQRRKGGPAVRLLPGRRGAPARLSLRRFRWTRLLLRPSPCASCPPPSRTRTRAFDVPLRML